MKTGTLNRRKMVKPGLKLPRFLRNHCHVTSPTPQGTRLERGNDSTEVQPSVEKQQ